jgi:hypothetical protein
VRSRRVQWAVALVMLAVVLVLVGRLERRHHADIQNDRIQRVLAAVGELDGPTLDAYRERSDFDCLIYKRGKNPYALELCVDAAGRVVEAIDRRFGRPRIGSLREETSLATHRVSRSEVERLVRKMEASPTSSTS